MISFIVAASENNAIGKDNQLLWHLPNDMRFFKNTTWGMPMIMGRKTFESMNKKFPGRANIVITRQKDWTREGVIVTASIDEAVAKAKETNAREIFIIGGGEIFKEAIPIADTIYMTRVHAILEGDAFFPAIDEKEWEMVKNEEHEQDLKHAYSYSFQTWKQKK
jgi:dihydrofolate reductase